MKYIEGHSWFAKMWTLLSSLRNANITQNANKTKIGFIYFNWGTSVNKFRENTLLSSHFTFIMINSNILSARRGGSGGTDGGPALLHQHLHRARGEGQGQPRPLVQGQPARPFLHVSIQDYIIMVSKVLFCLLLLSFYLSKYDPVNRWHSWRGNLKSYI